MNKRLFWFRTVAANLVLCIVLGGLFVLTVAGGDASAVSSHNGAYYAGDRTRHEVAVMVNVYQGSEYVEGMLDVLSAAGAKATFFVGGCWVEKNAELLKRIVANGHEVGNHGFFHKDSDKISKTRLVAEIANTNNAIRAICGVTPTLFAPPSGAVDKDVVAVAAEEGMITVMWSKDTIDWRDKDDATVLRRATDGVQNGDLILMHPTAHTLAALPKILSAYAAGGLATVTVSQCISVGTI